jgi:ABC-2 type transport system ATP-binding protein
VAVVLDGVVRRFGATRALDGLSLQVRRGETFGLLGHNGAGKTTAVRVLNGLLPPSEGEARVLGLDPVTDGPAVRALSGVLTETPALDDRTTAREALAYVADLHAIPVERVRPRVEELLDRFGLLDRRDARIGTFSRGMRQRLALARTLVHDPPLLFLDEPTTALDPVAAQQVHELIAGYRSAAERTVVICTHNLNEAQKLCDRVAILERGRLLALGTPGEIARFAGSRMEVLIEVGPGQEPRARVVLEGIGGGIRVASGDGHLVVSGLARDAIPDIIHALSGARLDVFRVQAAEPTLEDAYFALHAAPESRA